MAEQFIRQSGYTAPPAAKPDSVAGEAPLIPTGFDPIAATPEQLDLYGLPPRPDPKQQPSLYAAWSKLFARPLVWVDPLRPLSEDSGPAGHLSGPRYTPTRFETSQNWSGAYIEPNGGNMFVLLIGGTMGTLYFGLATPTEAAALGCVLAIVIAGFAADLSWTVMIDALKATTRSVGNLLFIIYTAYIFAYAISVAGVGEDVTSWVVGLKLSRLEFFLALFILYTVLGCLVESFGMIVITVPLLYPVLLSYGIDPVWFGIILVVFIELGQISPPIGINLFVIQSISRGKFSDVVMGTVPFHILMFVLLILLVIFPEIALWLPNHMLGVK